MYAVDGLADVRLGALPLGKFVSAEPSTAGSFADPSSTTTFPALVPVEAVEAVPSPVT